MEGFRTRRLPGLAPWIGGKHLLAARLAARIDRTHHHCYAEPFAGMGGVFFARRRRVQVEVLNDINGDLVNLFRIVRRHPRALLAELRLGLFSREEFERLLRVDPATLTDVERAARFLYLQRARYGGKPESRSFPAARSRSGALDGRSLRRRVLEAHRRLERTVIERLPYEDFIGRYDGPGTLFYLSTSTLPTGARSTTTARAFSNGPTSPVWPGF